MSCIFCDIADKKIRSDIVYEDEQIVAFRDVNPQAPTHILVIPRKHISTINDIQEQDVGLIGRLIFVAKEIAYKEGCAANGYRLVMNCNNDGGQTVYHVHLHLLCGRWMTWPPG